MHTVFGGQLRAERTRQGISTEALAAACSISRSYVVLIEGGRRLPGKKVIPRIATALNLTTVNILNWYLDDMSEHMKKSLNITSDMLTRI